MPRRSPILESTKLVNTAQICRESIRILLLHPTHFNSISIFLFSPLPLSLFISHHLTHQFPNISFTTLKPINHFFEENGAPSLLLKLLSNSIFATIICFPSSITFSLIGKASTIRAVVGTYNGMRPSNGRLLRSSGIVWVKLLHTCFWEFLVIICLTGVLVMCLAAIPSILYAYGLCSRVLGFWGALGLLGIPFCVGFAHVLVVGNLACVVAVLEGDCYGFESLVKAKDLVRGRRQTALVIGLLSNLGLRFVEGLFEFRMCRGMRIWEGYILVSMYSLVLVLDTVMNVVFYYTCKP